MTNEPPSGGTFVVLPKVGRSLETIFVLSMPLWYDEDLPLRFAFFIHDDESSAEIMLGSSFQPFVQSVLPPNSRSSAYLIGKVFDSLGSFSKMSESVVITLPPITSIDYASKLISANVSKFLGVGDSSRALQISMGAAKLKQVLLQFRSANKKSLLVSEQESVVSGILASLNYTVHRTRMKQAVLKQFQQVFEFVAETSQTRSDLETSLSILSGLIDQIRLKSLDVSMQDLTMFSNSA